jgi:hypothetical protein
MFHTPAASTSFSSTSRRTTRASRNSTGSVSAVQHSKKKKKASLSLRRNTTTGPVRKWTKAHREPADNAGFKVIKWVPIEDLTFDEKIAWDEEHGRQKGTVITEGGEVPVVAKGADRAEYETQNKNESAEKVIEPSTHGEEDLGGGAADSDDSTLNDSRHIDDAHKNHDDNDEPPAKKVKIQPDDNGIANANDAKQLMPSELE